MMTTPQPAPPIIRLKKEIAVNDNSPQSVNDYERGRTAGWDANNEFRRDQYEMLQAVRQPGSSLVLAIMLTIFGGLFALANFVQAYRWHNFDFAAIALAIVPITGAFFLFRRLPEARRRAKEAEEKFRMKWNNK